MRFFKHVVTSDTQMTAGVRNQFVLGLCRYAYASEKASRFALFAFSTREQLQRVDTEAYRAVQPLSQSHEHEYRHARAYGTLLVQVTAKIHSSGKPDTELEWERVNALEKTHTCQNIFLQLRRLLRTAKPDGAPLKMTWRISSYYDQTPGMGLWQGRRSRTYSAAPSPPIKNREMWKLRTSSLESGDLESQPRGR
jgi:hypothetical protein